MHNADMHEHISHKAPCLVVAERIVNEQSGRRSICILTELLVIVLVFAEKNRTSNKLGNPIIINSWFFISNN